FRYSREAGWVVRGLDLDVRMGDVHAVVGGNGCGKSTLLRLAAGVLRPERGRVANRLAARQALLPQNPKALFVCDTGAEELREWQRGCGYGDDAVDAALGRFSLAAHAARHPYDLSGGQQQLLAFAKILLTDPDLLLLDEPTKGLDTPTKRVLADAVRSCARSGATVVLVTHDLAFAARVADRATMLFDGEAACTEPAEEFFAGNLFYRRNWFFFRTRRRREQMTIGPDGGAALLPPAPHLRRRPAHLLEGELARCGGGRVGGSHARSQ
ncbi:MAG: ATP-binding cassette domain-containing protein, partial [Gordonibacter urolithinfaciens]